MKIVYISFLLFNYVSFMLSRLFNPLSARDFWKNRIFTVKKLSQNCRRRIKDCRRANVLRRLFFAAVLFAQLKGVI